MEGLWYYFCAVFMAFSSKYEDYASIRNEMEEVSHRLISWYESHKRALPWRETSDPYAIWVSEIILQQTRVAQGYDYYVRFMHAFPSVGALAEADEDQVLRLWQGLGYYSRARNMHAAAKQIVAQGSFPETYDAILNLKGVGPYTAAAIASFAFGLPHAVVDGNVCRLMARLFAVEEPIDTSKGKSQVESLAKALMPENQSALFNVYLPLLDAKSALWLTNASLCRREGLRLFPAKVIAQKSPNAIFTTFSSKTARASICESVPTMIFGAVCMNCR